MYEGIFTFFVCYKLVAWIVLAVFGSIFLNKNIFVERNTVTLGFMLFIIFLFGNLNVVSNSKQQVFSDRSTTHKILVLNIYSDTIRGQVLQHNCDRCDSLCSYILICFNIYTNIWVKKTDSKSSQKLIMNELWPK